MCKKVVSLMGAIYKHCREIASIGDPDTAHIFLDEADNIVGYLWYDYLLGDDTILYIDYIHSKKPRSGYGIKMIAHLFDHFDINSIQGEASDEARGFWEKVGAILPNEYSDKDREMYNFVLKKDDFYKAYIAKRTA